VKLSELNISDFRRRLHGGGIVIETGPFTLCLVIRLPELADGIRLLYGDFQLGNEERLDFRLLVRPRWTPLSLGRFAEVSIDGRRVFLPFPRSAAMPNIEWALNWWIYNYAHHFLMFHAGVVATGDDALLLSGEPGSGKSTLCAALAEDGWRLLSDELALLEPDGLTLRATARPIALKNESIDLIQGRTPTSLLGPLAPDTHKGTIAHLKPPAASVADVAAPATPRWLVFPKFDAQAQTCLNPLPKSRAFMELAENAFNYRIKGHAGFQQLASLIDSCECYSLPFSSLDDALSQIDGLRGMSERSGGA
jgi:HprK-related kinase A